MAQPGLHRRGQGRHQMQEAERVKDFKVAARIDNHVRAARFHLLKGDGLPRLVGTARAGLGVGQLLVQAVAGTSVNR